MMSEFDVRQKSVRVSEGRPVRGSGAAEADELQQEKEQGNDVQIEAESSKHVLLRRHLILLVFPTQDKLCIKHQILRRDRERESSEMLQH